MTSITIAADDTVVEALKVIAEKKSMTVEAVAREALTKYIQAQPPRKRRYSFVGIARSGKPNLSGQVDSILKNAANRREGWSLG